MIEEKSNISISAKISFISQKLDVTWMILIKSHFKSELILPLKGSFSHVTFQLTPQRMNFFIKSY